MEAYVRFFYEKLNLACLIDVSKEKIKREIRGNDEKVAVFCESIFNFRRTQAAELIDLSR